MDEGEALWIRAKEVIAGGVSMVSKRPDMYMPHGWPTYFTRSKGFNLWDLDDNQWRDFCFMGLGTNLLGYSHPKVDAAVTRAISSGNLSTLNVPEEVFLAERLIAMHTWASKARFARTGAEACTMAVRLARASSGRDAVAFCGYHGWHDWYLAANVEQSDALTGHLLPGLLPRGVPGSLAGSAIPFRYNRLDELQSIIERRPDVGVIYLEVQRSTPPDPGFLEGVRALATKVGAVLVFDENTSAFRYGLGGMHLRYGVDPDVAVFGKTLGNGYAITAVLGIESVMESAQDTFMSSTFWTDRIGPAAALATLEVMAEENSPARAHSTGIRVQEGWLTLARENGLQIEVGGLPALANFTVPRLPAVSVKTYIFSEMLKAGYLAGPNFYASTSHTEEAVDEYLDQISHVFAKLGKFDESDLAAALPEGPAKSGFVRLT